MQISKERTLWRKVRYLLTDSLLQTLELLVTGTAVVEPTLVGNTGSTGYQGDLRDRSTWDDSFKAVKRSDRISSCYCVDVVTWLCLGTDGDCSNDEDLAEPPEAGRA